MFGVMVTPSIKSVMYLYRDMSDYADTNFHSQFGCTKEPNNDKFQAIINSHGTTSSIMQRLSDDFTQENYGNDWLLEGSYAYIFIDQKKAVSKEINGKVLIIFKNQGTNRANSKINSIEYNEYYLKRKNNESYYFDLYNSSCSDISGIDSINQIYSKESVINFSKINEID